MKAKGLWRFPLIGALISVLPVLIVVQMLRIQSDPAYVDAFIKQGNRYAGEYKKIDAKRGRIFDRNGFLLAGNETVYEVGIELNQLRNPETIALALNVVLGLDQDEVLSRIQDGINRGAVRVVLDDFVSQEKIKRLDDLKSEMIRTYGTSSEDKIPSLSGLVNVPHLQRSYPENDLASNVLGFVTRDTRGYFGIEENFFSLLAGRSEYIWVPRDPNRIQEIPEIPQGSDIVLTIDREIQSEMEFIIDKAIEENGAKSGTIIVMDPKTGEILALATSPRLNLNRYWDYSEIFPENTPFNRGISQAFEPGSVYKVLTMAAAIDDGKVTLDTSFLDTGVFEIGGVFIHNWDQEAWGPQDMQSCMQHSLNVCLAWVASELGAKKFYSYMKSFGIGKLTSIDLAGEVSGRLKIPGEEDWYDADLGTNAFGQGVSTTPLQLISAVSALANNGKIMAPHFVRSIIHNGYQRDINQRIVSMPIKPETAQIMSEMLMISLENESSRALVDGYSISGKTGTAEIPTPIGYTNEETNASFIGWGPIDDPKFIIYVWLEKPKTSQWGSVVAAPIFKSAVERVVIHLNIPPDKVRREIGMR